MRGLRPLMAKSLLLISPLMIYVLNNGFREREQPTRHLMGTAPQTWLTLSEPASNPHVRVVIRAGSNQELLLRSLIYSLRAQEEALPKMKVDYVLVPTEVESLPIVRRVQEEMNPGFEDILLLDLPESYFEETRKLNPYTCSRELREEYLPLIGERGVHKVCDFDHYVYYAATDRALQQLVAPCESCTHVLVTNGDNGYRPSFLEETLRRPEDIIVVSFGHEAEQIKPEIKLTLIDLGAVLLRKRVLMGGVKLFMTSLPVDAQAKQVHDADYWYVKDAVDRGMSYTILSDRLLMYHH